MIRKTLALLALTLCFTGCVQPEPSTFVLQNDGEADVYHDTDFWLELTANGTPVSMTVPGCTPKCGLIKQSIACALAARIPAVNVLAPGETTEVAWDGVYYETTDAGCYKERTAQADFEVTFCYGAEYDNEFGEDFGEQSGNVINGATVKDPVCETQSFERGEVVELLAE